MPTIDLLLDARATIAESLLWEPRAGLLYWIDIKAPALYRLDLATLGQRRWALPEDVGAFALLAGDAVLVALRSCLATLSLKTGAVERVADAPWDPALFRFNEGVCDGSGRFWVGCMFDPGSTHTGDRTAARLHCWTGATGLSAQSDQSTLHNGMAWSADGRTYYLSHSYDHLIFAFPYDPANGLLGERQVLARTSTAGIPDGAAVDEEGAYWCAMHGAGRLHRYAPDGTLLQKMELPVSQPTMCAFGGVDLRTLFVASASDGLTPEQREREPLAGALLRFSPGVRGVERPTHAS